MYKSQKIEIHFNFIGYIEQSNVMAEPDNRTTSHAKKRVAKYSYFKPLGDYLENLNIPEVTLTYNEIESIVGRKLCNSAYKSAAYWYPRYNSPTANVIFNAGYDIGKIDLGKLEITLIKPIEFCKKEIN